jgi:hypothetical protein
LNRRTGELFAWNEDWASVDEETEDLSSYPEWLRKLIIQYREVCNSDDWLPLPDSFEIHEWDILREFCETVKPNAQRAALLEAIRGAGAFRRFKDTAQRLGVTEQWYAYRGDALRQIAVEWLEENKIPYTLEKRRP